MKTQFALILSCFLALMSAAEAQECQMKGEWSGGVWRGSITSVAPQGCSFTAGGAGESIKAEALPIPRGMPFDGDCGITPEPGRSLCESARSKSQDRDRSWHLLTITESGTVTLLKELTKHECEFAMHRAKGEPATDEERAAEEREYRARADAARAVCKGRSEEISDGFDEHSMMNVTCQRDKVSSYSWSTGSFSHSGMKSAECFQ